MWLSRDCLLPFILSQIPANTWGGNDSTVKKSRQTASISIVFPNIHPFGTLTRCTILHHITHHYIIFGINVAQNLFDTKVTPLLCGKVLIRLGSLLIIFLRMACFYDIDI